MAGNSNLTQAKKAKKDEFYTQLADIEDELAHYEEHFKDKVVYLNCDDPRRSNFWHYFETNFKRLKLKKLIATYYDDTAPVYSTTLEVTAAGTLISTTKTLEDNGDFRSTEAIQYLIESDIVVSNPPFSLFRDYIAQLVHHDKKFLIIGNQNIVTYKSVFPLLKAGVIWAGVNYGSMAFEVPLECEAKSTYIGADGLKYQKLGNISWYTNLTHTGRRHTHTLDKTYQGNEAYYPMYDNYHVINVDRIKDIPKDYTGPMGVPITIFNSHNPEQFEILGLANSSTYIGFECLTRIGGLNKYQRVIIKHHI